MNQLRHTIPADMRQLYHADGRPVRVGDRVSFRETVYWVTGWPKNGHNRVWVQTAGGTGEMEFFPSVFDLVWGPPL